MFFETYYYLPKQSLKIVESFKVCYKLSRNLPIRLFFHDFVMIQTCTYVCLSIRTLHNGVSKESNSNVDFTLNYASSAVIQINIV